MSSADEPSPSSRSSSGTSLAESSSSLYLRGARRVFRIEHALGCKRCHGGQMRSKGPTMAQIATAGQMASSRVLIARVSREVVLR